MANIALVVLDTLRKDSFDDHFDWLPGRRYENAWSPSGWTGPVHAALFGGEYPSELGVYAGAESLDVDRAVLAEALADEGYTTRAFSSNAIVSEAYGFDRGFTSFSHSWRGKRQDSDIFDWDDFVSRTADEGAVRFLRAVKECVTADVNTVASLRYGLKMKARDLGISGLSEADDGARQALSKIRETEFGDDEFYFLNLMEAHGPYDPPAEYRSTDYTGTPSIDHTIGEDPDHSAAEIRQAYEDSVAYLSDVYQDIFQELRSDFDYVITLGDHGDLFGVDGVWSHNHGIYPGLVHVPLCISTPEDESEHLTEVVSLLDVHKTVADIAGISLPSRGQNLLDDPESRDVLVERFGLRSERIEQLRRREYDEATIEKYNKSLFGIALSEGGYRYDTVDGVDTHGPIADDVEPEDRLAEARTDIDIVEADSSDTDVPDDVRRRLQDLGYA
jgi:arylsulfatase A-like enzyme